MFSGGSYLIPMGFDFVGWMNKYMFKPIIALVITILKPLVASFLSLLGTLIKDALSAFLFNIYTALLTILDVLQFIFDRLSGAKLVHKDFGVSTVLGSYMTNYFINLGVIKKAFFGILALSVILCFVFTIVAVAKSSMDLSGHFAIGEVIRNTMKALFIFFALQFLILATVSLSNYTLTAVDEVMGVASGQDKKSSDMRIANIVFVCSAIDAAKDGKTDIFDTSSTLHKYYTGPGSDTGLLFNNSNVYNEFSITKVDYILGAVACILMAYVLMSCVFFFVQRVVEVVFLYLVSPFFVASMPLDGGQRYKGWKDMFVAKCIASYGSVVTMKLFFIFVPIMMGGSKGVSFTGVPDGYTYFIRLLFVIGAGFAVKKAQGVLLQIVNPQAAGQAEQSLGGFAAMFMAVKSASNGLGDAIRGKKT